MITSVSPYLPRQYIPCIFANAIRENDVAFVESEALDVSNGCITNVGKQEYTYILKKCHVYVKSHVYTVIGSVTSTPLSSLSFSGIVIGSTIVTVGSTVITSSKSSIFSSLDMFA